VPVTDLPAAEQMPAGPLVLGAYGFMWAVVLVYVFLLSRRLQSVQKDIEALKRQTRN
jgi:CcmD family protein